MLNFVTFLIAMSPIFLNAQIIDENEYFKNSSYSYNSLNIGQNSFILYGDNGVILRTYDAGESWKQDYSGTKDTIVRLVNHGENIVGYTNKDSIMVSEDKGDHWRYTNFGGGIKFLDANDDVIVLLTPDNHLLLSSDLGFNWSLIESPLDDIIEVHFFGNRLFAFSYREVKYSEDYGKTWENILIGNDYYIKEINFVVKTDHLFSIYDSPNVLVLDSNLNLTKYSIQTGLINNFRILSGGYTLDNEGIYYFISNIQGDPLGQMKLYFIDKLSKNETLLSEFYIPNLMYQHTQFKDISTNNDTFIVTLSNSIILKSNDRGANWEVENYKPLSAFNEVYFWDKENWTAYEWYGAIYNSSNSGATFKPSGWSFHKEIDGKRRSPYLNNAYFYNNKNAIAFNKQESELYESMYVTDNGGESWTTPNPNLPYGLDILFDYDDFLLVERDSVEPKSNGTEGIKNYYSLNNNYELEYINSINNMNGEINDLLRFDDKLYLFSSTFSPYDDGFVRILYSDDTLKTVTEISRIPKKEFGSIGESQHVKIKSKMGFLFLITDYNFYFKINTLTNEIEKIHDQIWITKSSNDVFFIEDGLYYKYINRKGDNYRYVELTLDEFDELKTKTIGFNNLNATPEKFINSEGYALISRWEGVWNKISPDRLTVVENNIGKNENKLSNMVLYPNPIQKGKILNIEIDPIVKGEVEINITGIEGKRFYKLKDYFEANLDKVTLNKEINISAGVYILELKYSNGTIENTTFIVE